VIEPPPVADQPLPLTPDEHPPVGAEPSSGAKGPPSVTAAEHARVTDALGRLERAACLALVDRPAELAAVHADLADVLGAAHGT